MDTKRRNRISPLLMEALQMLKFHFKKERLNFTEGWETSERLMTEDGPDNDDQLATLLQSDFHNKLDKVIKLIETYEAD